MSQKGNERWGLVEGEAEGGERVLECRACEGVVKGGEKTD